MIGDTVYLRDENRRHYVSTQFGSVYRKYFAPFRIVGETKTSWLLSPGDWKVEKQTGRLRRPKHGFFGMCDRVFWSLEEVDDDCYIAENRHPISQHVLACQSATTLRQIATLLGGN